MKKFLDNLHPFPLFLVAVTVQGVLMLLDVNSVYIQGLKQILWGWVVVNAILLFMTIDNAVSTTQDGYIHLSRWTSIWLIVVSAGFCFGYGVALILR